MGLVSNGDSTVGVDVLNDLLDESSAQGGSDPPGTDDASTFNFGTINEALDDVIKGKNPTRCFQSLSRSIHRMGE